MKTAFLLALVMVCDVALAADRKQEDLRRADSIEVWDQRVSDLHSTPTKITESEKVIDLVNAIQDSPGTWKRGSFTAPSGYLRFVFRRGAEAITGIRLGEGFLVRGGGGDWEFKEISKDLEAKLASFMKKKEPSKSAPANRRFGCPLGAGRQFGRAVPATTVPGCGGRSGLGR